MCAASESPTSDGDAAVAALGARSSVGRMLNALDARRKLMGVGRGARRLRRRRGRRQLRRCSEVKTLATTLRARFTATPPSRFRCACALLSNDRAHSRRLHRVVGRGAQRAVPRGATRRLREVEGVRRSPPGATFSVARTPRPLKA